MRIHLCENSDRIFGLWISIDSPSIARGGLRGYMGFLIWRTVSRGRRNLELRYILRPHGSEHFLQKEKITFNYFQ
jgi:hypothetical protein